MNKLDSFEWLLIIMIVASFITGIFVAVDRDQQMAMNITKTEQHSNKL
ncbi:hypothetical protein PBAL39_13020 [Pedobacter sp. BAL39]|nr:hypothetical protein PBAL39_13020 [Pedobacter sp. BAL39]